METKDITEIDVKFIFETFDEGMAVHKKLYETIREKGSVTYKELYYLAYGIELFLDKPFVDYGWTNLWKVKLEPDDDMNWVLKMPEIKYLKEKENK